MPNQLTLDGFPPPPEPDEDARRPAGNLPPRLLDMHRLYGASPGNICKNCGHLERHRQGARWLKCGKARKTASRATDWKASWPACGLFPSSSTTVKGAPS